MDRRVAIVIIVLAVSWRPLFLTAQAPPQKQRETNLKRLEEMTVTELQRLDENYRLYQEMPKAERDRLKELHQAIENDPALMAAFQQYQAWADSLLPLERHELRNARNNDERSEFIEKYRRRQPPPDGPPGSDRRPNSPPPFGPNFIGRGERPRLLEKLFGRNVPLAGDRLASFVPEMEAIVRILESDLPPDAKTELGKLDPFTRKVRVVRMTLERHPAGPPAIRIFGPPDSDTANRMIAALPDGQVKQLVTNRNPGPPAQRNILLMALFRGIMTEMQRQIDDHRPAPETLRRFHDGLPDSERKRVDDLAREDQPLELQQLYLKEQIPGIAELQQLIGRPEIERFFQDMTLQMRGGQFPPEADDRRNPRGRPLFQDGNGRPREPESPRSSRPLPRD